MRLWLIAAVVTLAAAGAAAQEKPAGPGPSADSLVADQLLMMTRQVLSGLEEPRPDQLQRAKALLLYALELNSASPELWRLRWELARQMNDAEGHLDALRRYCNLQPTDDAAQLALVLRLVGRSQKLEERLAATERLLDSPAAGGLSAALRSRLALYVAQGAAELGDANRFAARLRQAVTLDPANPEAARVHLQVTASRPASPAELGAALTAALRAAPLDAPVRRDLADLLLSVGAYRAAATQYQLSQVLSAQPPDPAFVARWAVSLAASGQTDDALNLLAQLEALYKTDSSGSAWADEALASIAEAKARLREMAKPIVLPDEPPLIGAPTAPAAPRVGATQPAVRQPAISQPAVTQPAATQPEWSSSLALRLPIDLELLRLAILVQTEQMPKAQASFARMRAALQYKAAGGDVDARLDLLWLSVLFPTASQVAPGAALEELGKIPATDARQPVMRRIAAWIAMLQKSDQAREGFKGLAERDPYAAYGLALLAKAQGDRNVARAHLQRVIGMAPDAVPGLLAAGEYRKLEGREPPPTGEGPALLRMLDQLPRSLREPDPLQQPWLLLDVQVQPSEPGYLEAITAKVSVKNVSVTPLALGPGGTIPTRLFLFTAARSVGVSPGELPPIVVDLGRRLRLGPKESVSVDVRLDWGELGALLAAWPIVRFQIAGTATLDPRPTTSGGMQTGPLGSTVTSDRVERRGLAVSIAWLEEALACVDDPNPVKRLTLIAILGQIGQRLGQSEEAKKTAERFGDALTKRCTKGDRLDQAWIVRFAGSGAEGAALFKSIHELAQRSDDPLVRITYLATHVGDPRSAAIDAALRHADPKIAEYAKAHRAGLEAAPPAALPGASGGASGSGRPGSTPGTPPPRPGPTDRKPFSPP